MKYTVTLRRFEDENGIWGFTHDNTFDADHPFDAFYNADGIMHDLYEHWFEGQLKPFCGNNMCNVYGEIVASAMRLWMQTNAGFHIFSKRSYYSGSPSYSVDTIDEFHGFLDKDTYNRFPVHAIPIPRYKYVSGYYYYNINSEISKYWDILKEKYGTRTLHQHGIKESLIRNASYYGFNLAERIYGKFDRSELNHFFNTQLDYWDKFTRITDIKSAMIADSEYGFKGIQFTLSNETTKRYPSIKMMAIDDFNQPFPMESII